MKRLSLIPLLLSCCAAANAVEMMQWRRIPLSVDLHIGHERVLFINKNVRVGYPAELDGKLRIQSSGGTVYLLAKQAFASSRLQLRDVESGELILLDIQASKGKSLEPVALKYDAVYHNSHAASSQKAPKETAPSDSTDSDAVHVRAPIPVTLTRYAAQLLYAPLRTVEPVAGIRRVPLHLPASITTLLPTELISAKPLSAWRLGAYTVAAIKLQNRSRARIDLDPHELQGDFLTATFQHNWLGAAGTPEDTTVVYLVSDKRPDSAILPEPQPKIRRAKK